MLVNECKFANADENIIDALIFGSSSRQVQSRLLKCNETLTLNKAIDIARTEEAANLQLQDISGTTSINSLCHKNNRRPAAPSRQRKETCGNCGTLHDHSQNHYAQHLAQSV